MADITNGDGSPFSFDRKLDRINDSLANLTAGLNAMRETLLLEMQTSKARHELVMEEIRGLMDLQKEHRIDIMALFESARKTRERLDAGASEGGPEA